MSEFVMVTKWPVKKGLLMPQILTVLRESATEILKDRYKVCAFFHNDAVEECPDLVTPWEAPPPPPTSRTVYVRKNRQDGLHLAFLNGDYENPEQASNDPSVLDWTFSSQTRLTDTYIYLAIKCLTKPHRHKLHPYDFTKTVEISLSRIPSGKPVIIWAHNLAWIAVWRKSYILCGEKLAERAGWLIPPGMRVTGPSGDASFLAGIVLAPTDIFPLEPGTFEIHLKKHVNAADQDPLLRRDRRQQQRTNFCTDWDDFVLDLTLEGPILVPMNKVPFFRRPCANPKKYPSDTEIDYAPNDDIFSHMLDANIDIDLWNENFCEFDRHEMSQDVMLGASQDSIPDEQEDTYPSHQGATDQTVLPIHEEQNNPPHSYLGPNSFSHGPRHFNPSERTIDPYLLKRDVCSTIPEPGELEPMPYSEIVLAPPLESQLLSDSSRLAMLRYDDPLLLLLYRAGLVLISLQSSVPGGMSREEMLRQIPELTRNQELQEIYIEALNMYEPWDVSNSME